MTTTQSKDELIAAVQSAVNDTSAYFEGPGQTSRARIDRGGAWDVLAHFGYWHYAPAKGVLPHRAHARRRVNGVDERRSPSL